MQRRNFINLCLQAGLVSASGTLILACRKTEQGMGQLNALPPKIRPTEKAVEIVTLEGRDYIKMRSMVIYHCSSPFGPNEALKQSGQVIASGFISPQDVFALLAAYKIPVEARSTNIVPKKDFYFGGHGNEMHDLIFTKESLLNLVAGKGTFISTTLAAGHRHACLIYPNRVVDPNETPLLIPVDGNV